MASHAYPTPGNPGGPIAQPPWHRSIGFKLTGFVAALVVLTGAVLLAAVYVAGHQLILLHAQTRLTDAAEHRRLSLLNFVNHQQERATLVASRTALRRLMEQHGQRIVDEQSFRDQTRRILSDALASIDGFESVWITDATGLCVSSTHQGHVGNDYSQHPEFKAARLAAHMGLPRHRGDDEYYAYLSAPAWSTHDQTFLGVVMIAADMAPLQRLLRDVADIGQTGQVMVAVPQGERHLLYILPPLPADAAAQPSSPSLTTAARRDANPSAPGPTTSVRRDEDPVMAMAVAGQSGLTRAGGRNGRRYIAAFEPVGYEDWGIVTRVEAAEVLAPLRALTWWLVVLGVIMALIGTAVSYVIARSFIGPLRKLTRASSAVAAGDLNATVAVEWADEIGVLATAFNRMTAQLNAQRYELEKHNRELQAFTSIAAHDLNEPLRKIHAFGDRLRSRYTAGLDERGAEFLRRIITASQRMQKLINDLLTYTRVTSAPHPFEPVSLARVAREAVSDLEMRLEQTGGKVEIGALPTIQADLTQMRQLFMNMIGNALKFHRPGVDPVVRVYDRAVGMSSSPDYVVTSESARDADDSGAGMEVQSPKSGLHIIESAHAEEPADAPAPPAESPPPTDPPPVPPASGAMPLGPDRPPDGETCQIVFEDNGIGMDEKHRDRIFGLFQRLHGHEKYEGSGVGLAVCHRIVERHGGTIQVRSQPNDGATFIVTLPVRQTFTDPPSESSMSQA